MAAAGVSRLFLASVLLFCFVGTCFSADGPLLSKIDNTTLTVSTAANNQTYLKAGVNSLTVTWSAVAGGNDADWKTITLKLCYAPISRKDRAWRKPNDLISKDKACQFKITSAAYSGGEKSFTWVVQKNIPTAYYFVRAYAIGSSGHEVAYGQSQTGNVQDGFFIEAISGRHLSLDIASVTFSAFSVISLFGFFWLEKSKAKRAAAQTGILIFQRTPADDERSGNCQRFLTGYCLHTSSKTSLSSYLEYIRPVLSTLTKESQVTSNAKRRRRTSSDPHNRRSKKWIELYHVETKYSAQCADTKSCNVRY